MAEKFVSPGVFTQENDLSFLPQGIAEIGSAVVGTFSKGPAFTPTLISSTEEFREVFGGTNEKHYASYAVQNILQNSNTITVVRVGDTGGYSHDGVELTAASASVTSSIILAPTNGNESISIEDITENGKNLYVSTSVGTFSGSFDPTDELYFPKVLGTNPQGPSSAYVYAHFESTNSAYSASFNYTVSSASVDLDFDGSSNSEPLGAFTPFVKSQNIAGTVYDLFKFHRLSTGTDTNTDIKISIQNVKRPIETGATYAIFDVIVRDFNDTDNRPIVKETFSGLTLDPGSPNFIARRIGDQYRTIEQNGDTTIEGSYQNRSNNIRVEMAADVDTIPTTATPAGFEGYINPLGTTNVPDIPYLSAGGDVTGSAKTHFGVNFDTSLDWKYYHAPIKDSVLAASSPVTSSDFSLPTDLFAASATGSIDQTNRRFTLGFQGGFDGGDPTRKRLIGKNASSSNNAGLDFSSSTASGSLAYIKALNAISNPLEFDYNLLITPGINLTLGGQAVINRAKEIVEDRSDVFYIADLANVTDNINDVIQHASGYDSSFIGTYYPWVQIINPDTNKPQFVPPSVVMAGVYAFNDSIAAEWFAPAGLNRGGITEAINLYKRLKRNDMDTLYDGKVNPIVSFPGQGIVAFGQKTLQVRASALDRINVRRLLINLKKFIASTSRFLVFDQNTTTTRNKFLSLVEPYLQDVQQRQGLFAFRVVVDESVNTPEVIDRNQLVGKIFVQPARAAEFIVLDFNVLPTGAEFPA